MSGSGPSLGAMPPRKTHWQWSQPLENDQRPETRKPPLTRSTFPVGAYEELIRTDVSLPQTSFCACSGKSPSCQLWMPTTLRNHALDGQAAATSLTAWKKVSGPNSRPPHRTG
jgi:hypothetical protein